MKRLGNFLQSEAGSAMPMLAAAVAALLLANSPFDRLAEGVLDTELAVTFSGHGVAKPLLLWIDDGLMAIFFLLVGLEIKREVVEGELARLSQVVLPVAGAIGGIALPAGIYAAICWHDPVALRGWAVPAATDIAFAAAILAALGRRVPQSLKLFLLTLAIVDDLAAIVIIAVFYTAELSALSLTLAAICILGLITLNVGGVRRTAPYVLIGIALWVCVLKSGVHATLAGVALAFCIPLAYKTAVPEHRPFLELEHALKPWTLYFVLPAFAFANSGLNLADVSIDLMLDPVTLGIAAGLFLGKQFGVFAGAAILIKLGVARLPTGANWRQLYGAGACAGIGFTMSLFIGTLAFGEDRHADLVKVGVIAGSLLSAAMGWIVLRWSKTAAEG